MPRYTIYPYVSEWDGQPVWVFDDQAKGLINEGLVSGTDQILDMLASNFPDGKKGFKLTFSDEPIVQNESEFMKSISLAFEWVRTGTGEGLAEGVEGNWYSEPQTGYNGWLCPALFKYFDKAPAHIYVAAEPLDGILERGTGKVVIQGK